MTKKYRVESFAMVSKRSGIPRSRVFSLAVKKITSENARKSGQARVGLGSVPTSRDSRQFPRTIKEDEGRGCNLQGPMLFEGTQAVCFVRYRWESQGYTFATAAKPIGAQNEGNTSHRRGNPHLQDPSAQGLSTLYQAQLERR